MKIREAFSRTGESRAEFYKIIFGVWAIIAVYAIAHDQYLVRIAPEHFTIYHPNPLNIADPSRLAAYLAFLASISPGFVLAVASWFAGRAGTYPKFSSRQIFQAVLVVVGITEIAGATAGMIAYRTGTPLYPSVLYPALTRPLITTQSIQLTCYLCALIASPLMLLWMILKRRKWVTSKA